METNPRETWTTCLEPIAELLKADRLVPAPTAQPIEGASHDPVRCSDSSSFR